MVGVHLLESGVAILAIVQIGSDSHFPVAERRIVFEAELRFLFGRTEAEHQILRNAFIILPVFGIAVVQITVTDYHRLHMRPCIVTIYST